MKAKLAILGGICSIIVFYACKREVEEIIIDNGGLEVPAEIICPDVNGDPGPWEGSVWFDDWYAVEKVDCGTYIIAEPDGEQYNVNYLIVGSERAVLFDTGPGQQPLANVVDSLCDVPVTVVFSHFHYDHTGNLDEFDNVAFIDLQYLRDRTDEDGNFDFIFDEVLATSPTTVHVDEWWVHGEDIDLGGRTIELLNIPGHTWESVALVDRERKFMLCGDYMYNGPLFAFIPGSDLPAYKESAEFILSDTDDQYTYFGAHSNPRNDREKFETLIDLLDCIADGSCTATVFNAWGYVVYSYSLDGLTIWAYE